MRDLLRSRGYIVFRCAASKPIDLIALKDDKVLLVECKSGGARLDKRMHEFIREVLCRTRAVVLIARREGGRIKFLSYNGYTECKV